MIEFTGTGKTYHGLRAHVQAVVDFTLVIERGEVMGLAGPNGAGKSTLIALLLGYLEPTTGTVRIDGRAPRSFIEREGMGYLSELVAVPPRWRAEHALRRYALLAGVEPARVTERVEHVIALLGLGEHRGKLVKQLSKGNLQRLGLAQALLHDERVLILDEPTHGLDPVWTQRFRDIVDGLRAPDRTILIASHNLDELQRVADRVAIIDRGRLQRVVDTRTSRSPFDAPYRLHVARHPERVAGVFPDAVEIAAGEFQLPPRTIESLNEGLASLLAAGVLVAGLTPAHTQLEQEFREVVGG